MGGHCETGRCPRQRGDGAGGGEGCGREAEPGHRAMRWAPEHRGAGCSPAGRRRGVPSGSLLASHVARHDSWPHTWPDTTHGSGQGVLP